MPETIFIVILLAILFDISNGYNDAANAIATVVSTRVLTPIQAVMLADFHDLGVKIIIECDVLR